MLDDKSVEKVARIVVAAERVGWAMDEVTRRGRLADEALEAARAARGRAALLSALGEARRRLAESVEAHEDLAQALRGWREGLEALRGQGGA